MVVEISNLVVARFLDGRVLKGVTRDFSPNRAMFHIDPQDGATTVELRFRQLKALFFVASLEGDPSRQDVRGFIHGPVETQQGKKVAVRFRDGEFICGYTLSWSPDREGFFMFPADVGSNNQRIYVITSSTLEVKRARRPRCWRSACRARRRCRGPRARCAARVRAAPAGSGRARRPADCGPCPRSAGAGRADSCRGHRVAAGGVEDRYGLKRRLPRKRPPGQPDGRSFTDRRD
jgi:hypothetical protein